MHSRSEEWATLANKQWFRVALENSDGCYTIAGYTNAMMYSVALLEQREFKGSGRKFSKCT
jgi:hypothetical protein